jgi:hypothetical protein
MVSRNCAALIFGRRKEERADEHHRRNCLVRFFPQDGGISLRLFGVLRNLIMYASDSYRSKVHYLRGPGAEKRVLLLA